MTLTGTEKLSNIVRSVDGREAGNRSSQNTPTPWDGDRPASRGSDRRYRDSKDSRGYSQRDSKDSQRERIERYGSTPSVRTHQRQNSQGTGYMSQSPYDEPIPHRKHDYDLQAMESDLHSPPGIMTKNPIPPPVVTVRSEYPTLTRSKQSQIVTCLVTVEVPEGKWIPDPDDIRSAPPAHTSLHQEKEVAVGPRASEERGWSGESREELEEITEDLRARVENWHGLDFSRLVQDGSLAGGTADISDSASCACMAPCASAATEHRGRSLSASSLPRCLSASRRSGAHHLSLRSPDPSEN
jgi:hypothetical protein